MLAQVDSLLDLLTTFPDEQSCLDHLRAIRWRDGEFCPFCGGDRVYHFSDRKTFKCGDCRQRFSIKVGTIFEDTKLPLRKWFMAIWLITNHPKGIASTTLAKDLKVTQKTAWFVMHRLRHAAATKSFNAPLDGDVEIDETYVGGKAANRHKGDPKNGPGTFGKTAVVGAVKRGGNAVAMVIKNTDLHTLDGFVHDVVSRSASSVSTDEHGGYKYLSRTFNHGVVRHSAGEYVKGGFHTNSIEGFWSLLKRQIIGIHHWVSPKHLDRYVQEMSWRYNRRALGVGLRMNDMFACVEGRLTYKELIK